MIRYEFDPWISARLVPLISDQRSQSTTLGMSRPGFRTGLGSRTWSWCSSCLTLSFKSFSLLFLKIERMQRYLGSERELNRFISAHSLTSFGVNCLLSFIPVLSCCHCALTVRSESILGSTDYFLFLGQYSIRRMQAFTNLVNVKIQG